MMPISPTFLPSGSHTAELIRAFPWAGTALGPLDAWHPGMKAIVSMVLQSPVPIVTLWGPLGYMIYNDAYSVFAGGRHPTLLGSEVRKGWPEVADFNDNVMNVVMAGGTLTYVDQELTLHRTGQPEQVWMNLDYSPVTYDDGTIGGVIAVVVETTAKVKAERRIGEERGRLASMFEQAPGFMAMVTGPEHQYELANDAYQELAGHRELLGRTTRDVFPELVDQGLLERLDRAYGTGTAVFGDAVPFALHATAVAPGSHRFLDFVFQPLKDGAGNVFGIFVQGSDVTERIAAETALRENAAALAQMNATLESQVAHRTAERDRMWRLSKDILLVADFNAQLTAVSPAFTAILGWQPDDVLGRSFLDLVHPDDRDDTVRQVSALSAGANVFRFENRYRRKDGSYTTLSWTASPDAAFIHAIGRDITADIAQAEAMRRTEVALQQAQKMETIGKLTGGVAHDFNNLLQVISGNLQLMAALVTDRPDVTKRLDNALAGVERGAKLAGYLLAFARRQPLEPKVVKVSRLITGMEDMLRRSLGEEIEIETVMSGGLWSASIDVAQMENALLNLAINARDAMDGQGRLTIEVNNTLLDSVYCAAHPDVAPGQYVMIAVSDTGSGMPPDVLAQAFEPFFSTKPEGKGTGLGLSMVYGLVKQSGGHIKIYSEPGHGTTVKLYLPRTREAEDPYTLLDTTPVVGGTETVLVAEDDDAVRATVVDMLTELGYRVLKASDASAALTVIDSGVPIDLLFTDVVMPGPLRSPELARKAKERLPSIAVLFTSGYTENAIVHGGRLDAGVELIGKPYTKESLARKVRHVLANARQRSEPAPVEAASPANVVRPAPVHAKLKVLLVEDEEDIRNNTRDMIEFIGHDVVAVASAEAALPLLAASIDLLITDQQLPGMGGGDLIKLARAQVPHLQTALATGYGGALADASTLVLEKPYSLDDLRRLMQSLDSRGQEEA
ncbi:PAS domain S-box-containing protein [Pseudoduganella lurida]|uniref:histidine kinase n=1 Tax=Pseudoduganella lurida TaxID=1036180 RepID=A0A562R0Q6_9BURK|nr:PAS domain-containing protein [Pseudoduganella lurida]TWI62658.1 PAS domain S-box-containing protein [Pseudoduganella lurida]